MARVNIEGVQLTGVNHESAAISGKASVTTAGTAVALGSQVIEGPLCIVASGANEGYVYVGNDGADDVTAANGFELKASEKVYFNYVSNLADIYVDAAANNEDVFWLALQVV